MPKLIVGLCLLLVSAWSWAIDFKEGQDYLKVHKVPLAILQQVPAHKVRVTEFFSYGCPACYRLAPALAKWQTHLPSNVQFSRVAVAFAPTWGVYARAYATLIALNAPAVVDHALFKAIQQGKPLTTPQAIANFVAALGISTQHFLQVYHSPVITQKINQANQLTKQLLIFQVPTVVIDNQYRVDPSLAGASNTRLLATVDYVIQQQMRVKK